MAARRTRKHSYPVRRAALIGTACSSFLSGAVLAQTPAPAPPQIGASPYVAPIPFPVGEVPYPPYTLVRYDEDYRYLSDTTKRTDPSDRLKYIRLGDDPATYLTLGLDARLRFDSYAGYPLDPAHRERGGYLLQRYMPYADLHLGENVRVFGQLIAARVSGANPAPVVPYEKVGLDVDQLFADVTIGADDGPSVTLRLGRQELNYGAGRLIAPREGPNVRRPFDAGLLLLSSGRWRADLLYARPVQLQDDPGLFALHSSKREALYGVYATRSGPLFRLLPNEWIDLYYLGYTNDRAMFGGLPGVERRHTVGGRVYGSSPIWQYDVEAIGQFGDFAGQNITAWAVSALVGHLAFAQSKLPVGLTLGFDATSGDRKQGDRKLQTFNPLFPRAQYFTEAAFFGPSNLLVAHPAINFHPSKTVSVAFDALGYWRESLNDAAYNPSLIPVRMGSSRARYVATQAGVQLAWNPERHLSLLAYYAHLFPGPYLGSRAPQADYFGAYVNAHF